MCDFRRLGVYPVVRFCSQVDSQYRSISKHSKRASAEWDSYIVVRRTHSECQATNPIYHVTNPVVAPLVVWGLIGTRCLTLSRSSIRTINATISQSRRQPYLKITQEGIYRPWPTNPTPGAPRSPPREIRPSTNQPPGAVTAALS